MAKTINFKDIQEKGSYIEFFCPNCGGGAWSIRICTIDEKNLLIPGAAPKKEDILTTVCLQKNCGYTVTHCPTE